MKQKKIANKIRVFVKHFPCFLFLLFTGKENQNEDLFEKKSR